MNLQRLIEKAQISSFYLWVLNQGLNRMIPFNKPHGFKVVELGAGSVRMRLPYKRSNFNHIKGIHACALATISEFTTGFVLLSRLDPARYRIILKTLEMEYHYQGKTDIHTEYSVSDEWMEKEIYGPLTSEDAVVVVCTIKTFNAKNEHISTGKVHWQVKSWEKVRTKI